MSAAMKTIGIIGFGSFGRFLAEKLDPFATVFVYSHSNKNNAWKQGLDIVAAADYVILAIPLEAYESLLRDIKDKLRPDTILVDVCSVKETPISIIQRVLPNQPLLATHPLFGPESAKDSLKGHVLVLCPEVSDLGALTEAEHFAAALELKTIRMNAQDHDKEMSIVQGLTFFIAHALKDMKLHSQTLSTPSFEKLLNLAQLEANHSKELFKTIQAGNIYTTDMRLRFIEICKELDATISQ